MHILKSLGKYLFGYGSRLRNKLTLLFILVAVVPILFLSTFSLYLINVSHKYDISALELQTLGQEREEIGKFFSDTLGILELQVVYDKKAEIEKTQAAFLLDNILKANPSFLEVSFINLNGREILKLEKNTTSTATSTLLFDVSKLPRYTVPLGGQEYISETYETLSGPMVTLASPVYNSKGEVIEIISADVLLTKVALSIKNTLIGSTGSTILLDQSGRVISSGGQNILKPGDDLSNRQRIKELLAGRELNALSLDDTYMGYSVKEAVVGAGVRVPKVNWMLLAEWPLSDANATLNDVRYQAFLFTFLCILAVLLMAPIFSHQITAPVEELEMTTKEVEKGNFGVGVKIRTDDELEGLGNAFNHMVGGLKKLEELRNELIYIVTHELRSPVTAIRGYLSLITEGMGGEVSKEMKDLMVPLSESSDHLVQLINDLLEVARSEAGRLEIRMEAVSLPEVIHGSAEELHSLASQKRITVQYDERGVEGIKVAADPMRVKQVIVNLISNAIKYGKVKGFIRIRHEVTADMVTTYITDDGLGMSAEDQKHLFEKFYRSSKVGKIIGTGLGLFITKELVEKMGGTITCVSKEGEGTTFGVGLRRG